MAPRLHYHRTQCPNRSHTRVDPSVPERRLSGHAHGCTPLRRTAREAECPGAPRLAQRGARCRRLHGSTRACPSGCDRPRRRQDGFRVMPDRATGLTVDDPGRGRRPPGWNETHRYPMARDRVAVGEPSSRSQARRRLSGRVRPKRGRGVGPVRLGLCLVVDDETLRSRLESRTDNDSGKIQQYEMRSSARMRRQRRTTSATAPRSSIPPGRSRIVDDVVTAGRGPLRQQHAR